MRVTDADRSRKFALQRASPDIAKREIALPRLLVEVTLLARDARMARQFEVEIGLDVLAALLETRQLEDPQIEPRHQILAKTARLDLARERTVRSGNELEVAVRFLVGADGQEALLLDRAQNHGLLVETEFADLIEKQHALVRRAQQSRPIADGAR